MEKEKTVAEAINELAYQLKYLGNGGAATTTGAMEYLSVQIKAAGDNIASAITYLADTISDKQ